MTLEILDLGRISYADAHRLMQDQLKKRIAKEVPDTLLICEHPAVYTVGRHKGSESNVLAPGNVPVISVERGGDVTFHGPGQLVGYPICQLPEHRRDLIGFLRGLEDFWMTLLKSEFEISSERNPKNTGVWIGAQKIVAMGIACRQWTTWHGFAWNLTVDLSYYGRINPCGMTAAEVTSMTQQGHLVSIDRAKEILKREFPVWWEKWRAK